MLSVDRGMARFKRVFIEREISLLKLIDFLLEVYDTSKITK